MNFDWTPEELEAKEKVVKLLKDAPAENLQRLETADQPELKEITAQYFKKLGENGYLGLCLGPNNRTQAPKLMAAQEELAKVSGSLFLAVEASARLFGGLVAGFGNIELVQQLVEPIKQGTLIGAVALSEPDPENAEAATRSDAVSNTVSWLDGNEYVVKGTKSYVTNAPIADCIAVSGEAQGKPAIFLVDPNSPGVEIGPRLRTLGYQGLAVSRIKLKDVRVSKERVLGPFEDKAPFDFVKLMQDIVLIMSAVGLLQCTVASTKDYAQSHLREGRPIFRHQEIRFKLADMVTLSQTAQLMAFRAGWLYSISDPEAEVLIRCTKVFAAESAEQVASMAMQISAGEGYLWDSPIQQAYRESKYSSIAGTTSEVARMFIADDLLKRYQV